MAFDFGALSPEQKVTAVYVAYYGRAADPAGRDFWSNRLDEAGGDLTAIIDAFGNSAETAQRFGTETDQDAVKTLYRQIFNREPEEDGLEFYTEQLAQGTLTRETVALDILNGAKNEDATIVENKLEAAENYTDTLSATSAEVTVANSRFVVSGVGVDETSVAASKAAVAGLTDDTNAIRVQGSVTENGTPTDDLSSSAGPIDVGRGEAGSLSVTGGASLVATAENFNNVRIGTEGGTGFGVVRGEGSRLVAEGPNNSITAGPNGTGRLLLEAGSRVEALRLVAGFDGNGEVLISGTGTEAVISPETGRYTGEFSAEGGFVRAGRNDGSNARIVVSDGALLDVNANDQTSGPGIQVARQPGSVGTFIVDGSDTRVEVIQTVPTVEGADYGPYLQAGRSGSGDVQVRNGGTLVLDGPKSDIAVSRGNSEEFENPSDAPELAQSRLYVSDGGTVILRNSDPFDTGSASGMEVGRRENGNGLVRVEGSESSISVEGAVSPFVNVGDDGQGVLEVVDGGLVSSLFMAFGASQTGSGTGTVSGPGSSISLSGVQGELSQNPGQAAFMHSGRSGTGDLTVEGGGQIDISGANEGFYPGFAVGFAEGASGTMTVTGAGSAVTISDGTDTSFGSEGIIHIGRQGTGDLTVSDGGKVDNSDNGILTVGLYSNGNGTLTITGEDASVDAGLRVLLGSSADFETGDALPDEGGTGQIVVESGGRLEAGASTADDVADVVVGANGTLEVESGGTLVGDVRVVGGNFDLADGATHIGEVIT